MTALTDLALRKRTVAIAILLMLVASGIWSARSLKMELLPSVEVPLATVLVVYPGADPQSVLDEVAVPVEGAVAGMRGLKSLHSTAEAGLSVTVAEFDYGTNMKDALATINQNLAGAKLPAAALQPKVMDIDLNSFPILRLSIIGNVDISELGEIAESSIKPRLEAIDGVRSVEVLGKSTRQIQVLLDGDKMAQAHLDVAQVSGMLQANNVLLPSGDIAESNLDVPIRTGYRITTTAQIEELVVRPAGMGQLTGLAGMGIPGYASAPGGQPSGAGITAGAMPPTADSPGGGSAPATASYRVESGDTLWDIALRNYGDGSMSRAIFEANKDKMASPEALMPGLDLVLPSPGQVAQAAPPAGPSMPATPFASSTPDEPLRVRDIGSVQLSDVGNATVSRTNGQPSIGLLIYRNAGANTVTVADAVKQSIDEILPGLGMVEVITIEDESTQIKQSMNDLTREAVLGALFAVVVIYAFLLSVRTTMVAAASIPVSMLITFILLNLTGMSLNMMTLGGMAVAVGRVVDDTVVVLENVYRHAHRGEPVYEAIHNAVGEVAAAVLSSTLTTVGVFLPLAFVGGIVGEIFRPFAVTVTFALMASLLVALTTIPVLAAFLTDTPPAARPKDTLLQRLYTPVIRWSLRRKMASILLAIVVLAASLAALPFVGTTFFPQSEEKLLQIRAELPPGTGTDATLSVARQVEAAIGSQPEVEFYQTSIGNTGSAVSMTGFGAGNNSTADIFVRLSESSDVQDSALRLREALKYLASSATITVSALDARGTGSSTLELVISGSDYSAAKRTAVEMLDRLRHIDGLANLQSDVGTAKPEISVIVDPEKAMQHGTTAAQVAMKVREMIVGQVATTVNLDDQIMDVLVRVRPEDANSVDKLKGLAVGTVDAAPLSEIADVRMVEGPVRLTRRDQKAAVTITGSITKADTGAVNSAIREKVSGADLPPGVNVQLGGVIEQQTEGFATLGLALIAAVVLVYFIMMATMGSLLDPLVILVSLPMASIGALLALLITGRTLGMAALIGMLMLIGIVVTNAIVLLDLVRQLRGRGMGIEEALVEAGRTRVRPILITAGTTILALVPLALGFSKGGLIATEMATVVIGGLATSTVLTLVVVPVVYSLAKGIVSNGAPRR